MKGVLIIGLLIIIGYLMLHRRRRYGFKHIVRSTDHFQSPPQTSVITDDLVPKVEVETTTPEVKTKVISMTVDQMADLFSPPKDDLADLEVTQEEMDRMVKQYKDKWLTEKSKPKPQNINYNARDKDSVVRDSIRESTLARMSVGKKNYLDDDLSSEAGRISAQRTRDLSQVGFTRGVAVAPKL